MKTNFTGGDWKVVNDENYPTLHQIWGSDGCMPVYIARTCYAVRSEQNAKLIASAPAMFEALSKIYKMAKEEVVSIDKDMPFFEMIEEVLKKASEL